MWYWFFWSISVIIARALFGLKVEGLENLPKKTNFIIVANHTSYLDPFVLGVAIPGKIYWLASYTLYRPSLTKWFMQKTESLREGQASEKLVHLLMKNKNVAIFPEGTRTKDGKLGEFRRGAALLALRTGRPIVPCAILGAYETLPVRGKFPRLFTKITVKIGEPHYLLKEFDDIIDDVYLQGGTIKIRNSIKEMLYGRK